MKSRKGSEPVDHYLLGQLGLHSAAQAGERIQPLEQTKTAFKLIGGMSLIPTPVRNLL